MVVWRWRKNRPDAGTPLLPLQPMENQQRTLWKVVGKAMGWKAGRWRHVHRSELFLMPKCDKAVLDFVAITDVGKFPPQQMEE